MISADIKTNLKQQEMKELVVGFYNFCHRSTFSKLEIRKVGIFLFNLGWYTIQLDN